MLGSFINLFGMIVNSLVVVKFTTSGNLSDLGVVRSIFLEIKKPDGFRASPRTPIR